MIKYALILEEIIKMDTFRDLVSEFKVKITLYSVTYVYNKIA